GGGRGCGLSSARPVQEREGAVGSLLGQRPLKESTNLKDAHPLRAGITGRTPFPTQEESISARNSPQRAYRPDTSPQPRAKKCGAGRGSPRPAPHVRLKPQ